MRIRGNHRIELALALHPIELFPQTRLTYQPFGILSVAARCNSGITSAGSLGAGSLNRPSTEHNQMIVSHAPGEQAFLL